MKRISSVTTIFKKKIIPYVAAVNVIICLVCIFILNSPIKELFIIIFPTIILSLSWLLFFRKLKVVYLGKDYLKVDNSIIFLKDIKSILKLTYLRYRIDFMTEKGIKSFDLTIDSLPFLTPWFIEEIKNKSGL